MITVLAQMVLYRGRTESSLRPECWRRFLQCSARAMKRQFSDCFNPDWGFSGLIDTLILKHRLLPDFEPERRVTSRHYSGYGMPLFINRVVLPFLSFGCSARVTV